MKSHFIHVETVRLSHQHYVGKIILNNSKSLNALNDNMIAKLKHCLTVWHNDKSIVMVWIESAIDKAFCAGGDIRGLYHKIKEEKHDDIAHFFAVEYELDYLIHTFNKPIVVWGNGIVMGGGLGLMAGGSHRVVTENSLLAMPEMNIGLFPDVGATWFLNQVPHHLGLVIAWMAYQLDHYDALYAHLAEHYIHHSDKNKVFMYLDKIKWSDNVEVNHRQLTEYMQQYALPYERSLLETYSDKLISLIQDDNMLVVYDNLLSYHFTEQKWKLGQEVMKKGSPLTARIIWHQFTECTQDTLTQCFAKELHWVKNVCRYGDVLEGIRALLIDKDKQPHWKFGHLSEVEEMFISDKILSKMPEILYT